jgi:uncharacterized membrane protein HdeD (DUF308 family)
MTTRNWWSLVIRGLLAFAVGVIAIGWPGITLAALVLLFGAYALLDGVVSIIGAWRVARAHDRWAGLAVEGIAGIAAAATTVLWPAITAFVLVGIISAWALITGIFEIMAAIRLRREIRGEWLLALSGVLSVLFGLFVFFFPLAGALAIALTIGIYSLAFGVLFIALGFRLRARNRTSYASSPIGVPVR